MKHRLTKQGKRAAIALAVTSTFAALGIGAAPAAQFQSASIVIEPNGEQAGGITCTWRETDLGASKVVYYTCSAGTVMALKACVYKNRVIYNSPTRLDTFTNVVGEEGGAVPFLSQKNGQISASTTTPIPELETEASAELCTEPSVETVMAVRWCNAQLKDETNNVVGATVGELYQEFFSGVGTVPNCP